MYAKGTLDIIDRREMLRVKIKSLADEARIIRREERRACKPGRVYAPLQAELWLHRVRDVRSEARATLLAYGFIRGRTLTQMEGEKSKPSDYIWKRVKTMLQKYGPAGMLEPEVMKKAA